uniref:Myoactive tetradecapeptide n=1 Tax=Amynthas vittatus TaxID=506674 RepID=MY14_AMYVI|nr:RecName: Full=Myoactive tetradecapeptide; AltName: Full=PTP [Amynthas vittatus]AAB47069.1 Pheretima tetradecapeptide, PTP=bioactive tetradecapeptide [Pheretima vittata=earthworms, gut, Peptide, 14 aa] [Amynthas vittatus]
GFRDGSADRISHGF